jgi:hypothetical protein
VDVIESAKTEYRPAFQDLIRDIKSPVRQWRITIAGATSDRRGERRRYYRLKAEDGKPGNMVSLDDLQGAVLD